MVECDASLCVNTDTDTAATTDVLANDLSIDCSSNNVYECSNVVLDNGMSNCQKEVSFSLPEGYSSCKLDSSIYSPGIITSDSNFIINCDSDECPVETEYSDTDNNYCGSLECYGTAIYDDDANTFEIDGKVLGIKIPSTSIYIDKDGITKAKVQITLNNYRDVHSWENMSIGLCEGNNEINEPLTQEIIQKVRSFFNTSMHKVQHERWRFGENVCVETRPVPRQRHHECVTFSNNPHTDSTIGKNSDNKSSEMLILNGGYEGIYFNYINGDNFVHYHHTDRYKEGEGEDLFVNRRTNEITIRFDNGSMWWEGMNDNPNIRDTLDTTNAYVFIKGLEGYTRPDIQEGRKIRVTFQPSHQGIYEYTTIDQDYNIREGSWGFRNTLQYCIDHCNNQPSCKGFTRDITAGDNDVNGRCWFHNHIQDYGGDDDGRRRLYTKGDIKESIEVPIAMYQSDLNRVFFYLRDLDVSNVQELKDNLNGVVFRHGNQTEFTVDSVDSSNQYVSRIPAVLLHVKNVRGDINSQDIFRAILT